MNHISIPNDRLCDPVKLRAPQMPMTSCLLQTQVKEFRKPRLWKISVFVFYWQKRFLCLRTWLARDMELTEYGNLMVHVESKIAKTAFQVDWIMFRFSFNTEIIIKFPYNARSDWLKERALSENRARVDDIKLVFKFLNQNFTQINHPRNSDKRNVKELFVSSKYGSRRPLLTAVVV